MPYRLIEDYSQSSGQLTLTSQKYTVAELCNMTKKSDGRILADLLQLLYEKYTISTDELVKLLYDDEGFVEYRNRPKPVSPDDEIPF